MLYEDRKDLVGFIIVNDFLLFQTEGDDPRNEKDEDRCEFEIRSEDRSPSSYLDVLRRKRALHDVLIGTPVPDSHNRSADEQSCPRKIGVRCRSPHVEVIAANSGLQFCPSSHFA